MILSGLVKHLYFIILQ